MAGVLFLLLCLAQQLLLFLYLRERLPDHRRPRRARTTRLVLTLVFLVANLPWIVVADRLFSGRVWDIGRIPYIAPFFAWQLLTWTVCALVAVYVLLKTVRGAWSVVTSVARTQIDAWRQPRTTHHALERRHPLPGRIDPLARRRFLAKATYSFLASGMALSAYGVWSAGRRPTVTRRTLEFADLPPGLDGLTILHLSDVHAGIHMEFERMRAIAQQANDLGAELIVQTGDMIDISPAYVPEYVRAFRDLSAPLGVVAVLGNHDHYTGEDEVIAGVRDAGQIFVRNGMHVIERGGAVLALLGIDDPRNWRADDPQTDDVRAALRRAPPDAFKVLLAHRPGAFDSASAEGIHLTLAGHIHGGQLRVPGVNWSAGRLITKYPMGHYRRGPAQLYVSRGIGVVGVPIRVFAPPEVALLTLRRTRI